MEDKKAPMADKEEMDDQRATVVEAIMAVEKEAAKLQEAKDARGAEENATGVSTPQVTIGNRASEAVTAANNFFYKGLQEWL